MTDALNALSTEDGWEPGMAGAELSSNLGLYKYLYAEGDGWKPVRIEHGRRIHGERMANPLPPRNQKLSVYEAAACQGSFESFFEMGWTTLLYRDDQRAHESLAVLAEANAWVEQNATLFNETKPIARTAPGWFKPDRAPALVQAGKNFVVLVPRQITPPQLAQFPVVILDNDRFLTVPQRATVVDYVRRGGHLLATGETAFGDAQPWQPLDPPGLAELFQDGPAQQRRSQCRVGQGIAVYNPQPVDSPEGLRDWARSKASLW